MLEIAWALVAAEDQGAVDKSLPELVVQLEGEGGDAVHLIHYFHIMISLFLSIDLKKRFYDFQKWKDSNLEISEELKE